MPAFFRSGIVLGVLLTVITSAFYGLYPVASRAAYADGANAVFMTFLTTFSRAAVFLALCLLTRQPLFQPGKERKIVAVSGIFQALSNVCGLASLVFIQGPVMLIVFFTFPLMIFVLMVWRGEAKITLRVIVPALTALVGLGYVLDIGEIQPVSNWIGYGLAFAAALTSALRFYLFEKLMRVRSPAVVGAESSLVALVFLLALLFWKTPVLPQTFDGAAWSLLCALSLGIGGCLALYCISMLGSFRFGLFSKTEPVFTSIFSIVFIGEVLKASQYFGMAIVLASLVIYQILTRPVPEKA